LVPIKAKLTTNRRELHVKQFFPPRHSYIFWDCQFMLMKPLTFVFSTIVAVVTFANVLAAADRPNIIVILADDLGFGDLSCNNPDSKIKTHHVDRLAAEGMRFTDAHSPSAVCTPTRYSLLTGRYHWRSRLKSGVLDGLSPPLIEADRPTVASFLRQQGYATACVGKWHLGLQWTRKDGLLETSDRAAVAGVRSGDDIDFSKPFTGGPTALGFDQFFGISASLNMPPFCYLSGDRPVHLPILHQPAMRDPNFLATDEGVRSPDFTNYGVMPRLAGEAIAFIESQNAANQRKPFFLYAPLTSPHLPVVTNQEYRGLSQAGEYGDFVIETDEFVGAILATLDRLRIAENTLVILTSDNGGLYHYWEAKEVDDVKHYRMSERGNHIKGYGHQGNAWMRGTKADIWEGGHRVPFVARWPQAIRPNAVSKDLVDLTDLMATVAEIVDVKLPSGAGPDSVSMLPIFQSSKSSTNARGQTVHMSMQGVFAIRQGPWKLIPDHRGSGGFSQPKKLDPAKENGPVGQLYNLEVDPSETRNIYADHPEIVKRLTELLESIRNQPS
jgi:arylsulfatase A